MTTSGKKQIPVREGLWTTPSSPDEKPQLIGSKCLNCGEVIFPTNRNCVNCQSQRMEDIKLSRRGKIYALSIVMLPPPKYYKGPVPFSIGWVELPDGVRVNTPFLGAEPGLFKVGQEVELVIEKLQEDDEGNEIMGFGFTHVKS
jgi:uncharacterized OB-fold protein